MATKKIKILYVITKSDVGGAQKYVSDLVNNIDQDKFEAIILAGQKGGGLSSNITTKWLSNSFRPYFLFVNDILAVFELYKIFKKERPDIIHLNSSKAGIVGTFAAWLFKKTSNISHLTSHISHAKIIFTAHGWVFNPTNDINPVLRWFYICLHKLAAYFQDYIINVSEYDRKLALKYKISSPKKLVTIHNGLDLKRLHFLDRTAARRKLNQLIALPTNQLTNLPTNQIWIGSIGRLVKEKDYETFIKAAHQLTKSFPTHRQAEINQFTKFFIIGDGPEKDKLQSLITNYQLQNRFFIIGNVSPAALYLKAFDIFVLSSIKEGLPYTLLEAMAAGLPIVTTRIGGMPEIIENHQTQQNCGLVVIPKEPSELVRAIKYLTNNTNESSQLALNAQNKIKTRLNITNMASATQDIYLR